MIALAFHWWRFLFQRGTARRIVQYLPMREELLRRACCAIRGGKLELAEGLVMEYGEQAWSDAACLNVLGLIAEARGQWAVARKRWSKALRFDPRYDPARQNLRRYYELYQWGRSQCCVAFGDEAKVGRFDAQPN